MGGSKNYSEEIAAEIDREVRSLVEEAYNRAETILRTNIDKLHAVAQVLLEKEKIDGIEFSKIYDGEVYVEIPSEI